MHPKPTGLRPRVILIAILAGTVLETGIFFLTLLLSGAYVLATVACLVLVALALGVALFGSYRSGSARRQSLGGETPAVSFTSPGEQPQQDGQH